MSEYRQEQRPGRGWPRNAGLLLGTLAILAACSQNPPVTPGPGSTDPYAGTPYANGARVLWTNAPGTQPLPEYGDHALSELNWSAASNSWGPVERDRSNGEAAAGDGQPLRIGGVAYGRGLGVHAASDLSYTLGGHCTKLTVKVGVDSEVGSKGSVVFQVWDGTTRKLSDSGVLKGGAAANVLTADLSGVQTLRLVVTDAGDGIGFDHADWADPVLSCPAPTPPPPPPPPPTLSYSSMAAQPQGVSEAQGRVVKGKLYTFGGFDSLKSCCTPTDRAYVYDPAVNRWASIAPMPDHGATHAGMTTDGTFIYYAGGYVANSTWTAQVFGTRAVWRYDPAANSYTRLPDLPVTSAAGQLEYLNGKLHYFGGTNQARTADIADHYVLDLAGQATAWTVAAPMPAPRNHLGSVVLDGFIYAIGGQNGHDAALVTRSDVYRYDPASDRWTTLASLPRARSHIANSTFVWQGRILVAGGETAHNVAISDVSAYNPATNTWTEWTPLPFARVSGVAAATDGTHFVFTGGNENNTAQSTGRVASLP
ncbi:NPCBM/NEW2 domain-containing protein [Deinococcus sonorensis]|uniref:NPCBM/NEW2 domain-containing protein n=2 Tax=Deinococcus sonorensis TaxID=309891 RepID=A0AAU7UC44_9DEIO